ASRRAGEDLAVAAQQTAEVVRMQSVDVLVGRHGAGDGLLIYPGRQRQLDDQPVEACVPVQVMYERDQRRLVNGWIGGDRLRVQLQLARGACLAADIGN